MSEEWYSRLIPAWPRDGLRDSCVDPAGDDFGGDEAGVRYNGAVVIISRNESSWRNDNALCRVSRGLMGGTPPKPSIAAGKQKNHFPFSSTASLSITFLRSHCVFRDTMILLRLLI